MYDLFDPFCTGNWVFESNKLYELMEQLSPEERELFQCDVRTIDWKIAN